MSNGIVENEKKFIVDLEKPGAMKLFGEVLNASRVTYSFDGHPSVVVAIPALRSKLEHFDERGNVVFQGWDTYLETRTAMYARNPDKVGGDHGYILRMRKDSADFIILTLKSDNHGQQAGDFSRTEIEVQIPRRANNAEQIAHLREDVAQLADEGKAALFKEIFFGILAGEENQEILQRFEFWQHRGKKDVIVGDRVVAEMTLDLVQQPIPIRTEEGLVVNHHYRCMEIEETGALTDQERAAIDALGEHYLRYHDLQPMQNSKGSLGRFLPAAVRVMHDLSKEAEANKENLAYQEHMRTVFPGYDQAMETYRRHMAEKDLYDVRSL